jgi:hypothetical protein
VATLIPGRAKRIPGTLSRRECETKGFRTSGICLHAPTSRNGMVLGHKSSFVLPFTLQPQDCCVPVECPPFGNEADVCDKENGLLCVKTRAWSI